MAESRHRSPRCLVLKKNPSQVAQRDPTPEQLLLAGTPSSGGGTIEEITALAA